MNTRSRCTSVAGVIVIGAALLLLAGCSPVGPGWMDDHHDSMQRGRDTSRSTPVSAEGTVAVTIEDYAFSPGNLQVTVGTTVAFTNRDAAPHTATADGGAWSTELLRKGQSGSVTFDEPGIYEYYCQPHPDMRARIEVTR